MKRAAEEEERGEAAPWGSGLPDELYYELAEAVLGESLGGWVEALRALASLFSASTSLRARGARLFSTPSGSRIASLRASTATVWPPPSAPTAPTRK